MRPNETTTGIIARSEVVIVPSGDTAKVQDVEDLFEFCSTKVEVSVSGILALSAF